MTKVIPNTESASVKTGLSYEDDFYMWVKLYISKIDTVISLVTTLRTKYVNCTLKVMYQHY